MLSARNRRILRLALPIIGGMLSQNVLNLVDTLMVGRLGDVALAAVGAAGFVQFFCTALITGLGVGVQAIVSRRVGQGQIGQSALPLNGGLALALVTGIPLAGVLYFILPDAFSLVASDADVAKVGAPYMQLRSLAVPFVALNFCFRGYFNGIEKSSVYFRTLVVMHSLNVFLNYLLIFGNWGFPEMGVAGAAAASSLAFGCGSLFYFAQAWHLARGNGFLRALPTVEELKSVVGLSLPTGLQQTFFAGGMTLFFALIGTVGTRAVAASAVLVNLVLVVILPSIGFGLASATLVGQALGRNDPQDARKWGDEVVRLAAFFMILLGAVGIFFPRVLLGVFLKDPLTLEAAVTPLRLMGFSLPIDAVGLVIMQSLLGAGDSRRVMWIGVGLQWCLQLPGVFIATRYCGGGLVAVWSIHFAYRGVQTILLHQLWRRGSWTRISI